MYAALIRNKHKVNYATRSIKVDTELKIWVKMTVHSIECWDESDWAYKCVTHARVLPRVRGLQHSDDIG